MPGQEDVPGPELGFEQALERLEATVERLEGGDLGLEEALRLFQEGMELLRHCAQLLDRAEGRVQVLLQEGQGHRLEPWT
ncbi:MAG: exodeoxyribonuclease VII small subunit, partial [Acetobacteraceae bacterium]|nr:exodeoxyribonuclease VII small subunit [Acetobacteraceae bacterium]